jgi:hypothetical protein
MDTKTHEQLVASWQRTWETCLIDVLGTSYEGQLDSYVLEVANLPKNFEDICDAAESHFYAYKAEMKILFQALSKNFTEATKPERYPGYNSLMHYLMYGDHQLYKGEFINETDTDRLEDNGLFWFDNLRVLSAVLDNSFNAPDTVGDNKIGLLLTLLETDIIAKAYTLIINYLHTCQLKAR